MNLSTILADAYRRLGYSTVPASDVTTRLTAFANETIQEILAKPGLAPALLTDQMTVASVANQQQYALAAAVNTISRVWEITNDRVILPMSADTYRVLYPDPAAVTGTPVWYVDLGFSPCVMQPSNASQLLVDSTAAGDTAVAYIEGIRSDGSEFTDSVTMNGTTAVNLGPSTTIRVTKFYIATAAVGTVTLVEDVEGGTELARISIGETFARRRIIALVPTPSTAITYTYEFERVVPNLVNSLDEPVLPTKYHPLVGMGVRMKEYERREKPELISTILGPYTEMLSQLRHEIDQAAVGSANLRGVRRSATDIARQRLTNW